MEDRPEADGEGDAPERDLLEALSDLDHGSRPIGSVSRRSQFPESTFSPIFQARKHSRAVGGRKASGARRRPSVHDGTPHVEFPWQTNAVSSRAYPRNRRRKSPLARF